MASHPPLQAFRDIDNKSVAYAPQNVSTSQATPYDSDAEPLITPISETHSPEDLQQFTATGRPMPKFKADPLNGMAGDMYSLPQLLPKRYTDESIIPAIVVDVIPHATGSEEAKRDGKISGFLGKLKAKKNDDSGKEKKGITKVVYMPRGEYKKYFARDENAKYIGSEPCRQWTEEELEKEFGKYKPAAPSKKGYRAPT